MAKRAILIILDSVGIGELPDSVAFGDKGSDTLGNIIKQRGYINLPNLFSMGLNKIDGCSFYQPGEAFGCYAKCAEMAMAKDTTLGHWEIAGIVAPPFRTFPNGFDKEIIEAFTKKIGRGVLGNYAASGTEIIHELGEQHVKTGCPIVYTSADSVFQIAAHEEVIPLKELYDMCEAAREILTGDYAVGRVIARPFTGQAGNFKRTENRRDYALPPPKDTILDAILSRGQEVVAIGKIEDIFCKRGISRVNHTTNNRAGIDATLYEIKKGDSGFIFTNLVDFDSLYGHRNDVEGYAQALEYFDDRLSEIVAALKPDDILCIAADHGCDPTTPSTDHSREYVPFLLCGNGVKSNVNLGVRKTFTDIGATIYEYLTGEKWELGESVLTDIR